MFIRKPTVRSGGIALIDLIAGIVVISIAVAGILAAISLSTQHSADPIGEKQALAIAEALLEEVEMMPFNDNCAKDENFNSVANACQSTTMRSRVSATDPFHNVFDYNGVTLTTNGTDLGGLVTVPDGYSANVTVVSTSLAAVPNAALITVRVSWANGNLVMEGYRTQYAPQVTS